jgi:hypothetical protein
MTWQEIATTSKAGKKPPDPDLAMIAKINKGVQR